MKKVLMVIFISIMIYTAVGCSSSRIEGVNRLAGDEKLSSRMAGDFDGYVGCLIKVGDSDIEVTHIGALKAIVNRKDFEMVIVERYEKAVILSTSSEDDAFIRENKGSFEFSKLSEKVTLSSGGEYFVLVKVISDDGKFYYLDQNTIVKPSEGITIIGAARSTDLYLFETGSEVNSMLGPVDIIFENKR